MDMMHVRIDHSFRWRESKDLLIEQIRQQEVAAERSEIEELDSIYQYVAATQGKLTPALTTKA